MGNSTCCATRKHRKLDVVEHMMPLYYTRNDPLTAEDCQAVRSSWNMIVQNQVSKYLTLQRSGVVVHDQCLSWFYAVFYERLFYVHPLAQNWFKNEIFAQGRLLLQLISVLNQLFSRGDKFTSSLLGLQTTFTNMNVSLYEMGIIGDVLFYSLKFCLDEEYAAFDGCWVKVYSEFLYTISKQYSSMDRRRSKAKIPTHKVYDTEQSMRSILSNNI